MIKSELKNYKKELTFPLLARNIQYKYIVLFVSETRGTLVFREDDDPIDYCTNNWTNVTNSRFWEILPSGTEIILKNL